jgi:hypothetical protein
MDPNLIPTVGGGTLLIGVWIAVLAGRAHVRRLRALDLQRERPDGPPDL